MSNAKKKKVVAPIEAQVKKSPVRLELHIVPDDTGLKMKEIKGLFVFKFPDDPFAGGAEQTPLVLDAKNRAFVEELYDSILAKFIEKHKTQSKAHGIAENAKDNQKVLSTIHT